MKSNSPNNIVFVRGNAYRAAGFGKSEDRKRFEQEVMSLLPSGTTSVTSKNFTKVPQAKKYVGFSKGCSRARKFGNSKAEKMCVDDFMSRYINAGSDEHYLMTDRLRKKLLSFGSS